MSDAIIQAEKLRTQIDKFAGWFKANERPVLLGTVGFQVVFLIAMVGVRATPIVTGETILLRVVPVDPRDLFRGDYVILNYEFSRTPLQQIVGLPVAPGGEKANAWQGTTVYASLVPEADGKHWRVEKLSFYEPNSGKYLRGKIGAGRLEFGIEAYYVQEGKGREYEQAIRNRRLSAEIALTANGQATLRGLRIE